MVPGAYRHTLVIENRAEIVRMDVADHEGLHAGFVSCRADQSNSLDALESRCHVLEEMLFVFLNVRHAD